VSEDELIFLGAAVLLAQMTGHLGAANETHIRTAVATAHRLRSEVKKQRSEDWANRPDSEIGPWRAKE
jgi:hypothetical protein